jgi:hypothetical protein
MILYGGNSGLIDDVYLLTATNSAVFNSAIIQSNINNYIDIFTNEILDAQDDWDFQGQIATANVVANQQDYPFPSDVLTVKRLEISDGTNWSLATPVDINEYRTYAVGSSAVSNEILAGLTQYSAFNNSLYLHPIPGSSVTSGLKLWYGKKATALSATTMEPPFTAAYHRGLSYGVAKDWFQKIGDPTGAKQMENEMEKIIARMKHYYSNRLPDREYRLKPLIQDYS